MPRRFRAYIPRVRGIAAFVLVNLLFVAGALIAAGTILALGTIARESGLPTEAPELWLVITLAGIAAGIWALCAAVRFISRLPSRRPARAQV